MKSIKAEYLPGGAKRQELLDQVPGYLASPGATKEQTYVLFRCS
jgi:hypothetical protein